MNFDPKNPNTWKPGDVMEITGFIHKPIYGGNPDFFEHDMSSQGYRMLFPWKFFVVVPEDFNSTVAEVKSIDTAIEKISAEYREKIRGFTQARNSLLQVGMSQGDTELVNADSDDDILIQAAKPIVDFDDDIPF